MQEGEGETNGVVETNLKSPEPESPKIFVEKEMPDIPKCGITIIPFPKLTSSPTRIILLDHKIPEGYWHIFDQMAHNQP